MILLDFVRLVGVDFSSGWGGWAVAFTDFVRLVTTASTGTVDSSGTFLFFVDCLSVMAGSLTKLPFDVAFGVGATLPGSARSFCSASPKASSQYVDVLDRELHLLYAVDK